MSVDAKDTEILKFCRQPHNRYQIMKHLSVHYAGIYHKVKKLTTMQLLFVVREESGPGPHKVKFFLITDKGRAVLRGFMEAKRE